MYKFIYLAFIILFTGCSVKNLDTKVNEQSKKNEYFTTREYKEISKDAIFEAAKKVFLLADKRKFRIDSYRDHLEVSKTKMSHFFLYPVTHEDRWNLSINEKDNTSFAKLELVRITDFDEEDKEYLSKYSHELFWRRLDYLLGINDKWISCDTIRNIRGTLCDGLDMYNNSAATKDDIVKNILIKNRRESQDLNEISDDILNEDIDFALDETTNDILGKEDLIDNQTSEEKISDEALDREIQELNSKVNSNIDRTLIEIKNDIKDEQLNKEKE